MPELPTGTVTFLFTDIEGSTRLWEEHPEAMRSALARHDALLRQTIEQHHGHIVKGTGDRLHAVFAKASDGLAACLAAQLAFQADEPKEPASIRIRMALHSGSAQERDRDYFGSCVNRAARLMSIGHGGQVLLSAVTQGLVRESLPEGATLKELGWHRLKDLQEADQVFQLLHPGLPAEFPALNSLDSLPNNLPRQLTSFIGREKEIEEVRQLLTSSALVTLTGTGGCGKTRLALQVAAEVLEDYPEGVWLVELAALSDPGLVVQTVATALGLREAPGQPLLQTLTDYLQSRTLLLVLDNCEHLIAACASLTETLLQACPNLCILATSREGLRIRGESVYRVPSLLPPDPSKLPSEEKDLAAIFLEYDAAQLFVERAGKHQSSFALTQQNAPAVASVCYRLEGIPLAIELAAARVRVLSVQDINARLEHRFRLLTGGSRTALPRQQTLQAALDWSYDLLTEQERLLLGRLSVFAGGWRLEAAEKVCSDEQIKDFEMLDLLTSLVDKSLVIYEEREGKSRYRLLETIREYGGYRLQQSGQEKVWRSRHLQFFLALAEEAESKLTGAEQGEWLERLQEEHDNLRIALQWGQQDKDSQEASLLLAGSLCLFWDIHGYWSEGREHLQAALSQEAAYKKTKARAKALNGAGNLAYRQGDYATARALYEESLAIRRELGDKNGIADSLSNLGEMAKEQGDYAAARALYEESLAIRRELGDKYGIAYTLEAIAELAAAQGQSEPAAKLWAAADALREAIGSPLPPKEKEELDRNVALMRASLGEEAFAAAWEQGQAMTIEQAIEYALQEDQQGSKERPAE